MQFQGRNRAIPLHRTQLLERSQVFRDTDEEATIQKTGSLLE